MPVLEQKIIDLIHNCYVDNFRFINCVTMDFPCAEIEFNLGHKYYTPDDRGGLSAANFVILFNQSFLCFLYGSIQGRNSHVLNALNLDFNERSIADHTKMLKMDNIKFRRFVSKNERLHAKLVLRKLIDKSKSANLVYFMVDFDVCNGAHLGLFTLVMQVS